ncbi:MAG: hypothetical protein OER56_02745 [Hyphomicrobiales bacterium]|nr:hypothetical protein [Hyphomicrobiales bacterium]
MRLSLKPFACITAIIWLLSAPVPVSAEDKQEPQGAPSIRQIRADCAYDREKYCGSVKRSKLTACLIENQSNLVPDCRGHIDRLIVARAALSKCEPDIKKHCAKAGSNYSKAFTCLARNKDSLTETCETSLVDARKTLKN